ncbi:MAG: tRNA epoxyqueuosine(34) reductase QueG [Gammaproteobacteria bacterium]|nr:tRNA epoxyqueuosine(34) reductase QueG [Gammaproteobacteria bacterium]
MNYDSNQLTAKIKAWSEEIGFNLCGITDTNLSKYQTNFKASILDKNYNELTYLKNNLDKRLDPKKLMSGTKSIIVCALNYYQKPISPHISIYAQGDDYHKIVKNKLKELAQKIETHIGNFNYRCFCDTAPVLEKALAEKAGIGWIGKNSLLITKQGSFMFLGEIFTDLELQVDKPAKNHCGKCTTCLKTCPTKAIIKPNKINIQKCLAYLTTEPKSQNHLKIDLHEKFYGCDECQLACPWNRFAKLNTIFTPNQNLAKPYKELIAWDEDEFRKNTKGTALRYKNIKHP